jgi:hypothetical protein
MAQPITASELILTSPDGTKEFRLKLENDGFLYYRDKNGNHVMIARIDSTLPKPQYE